MSKDATGKARGGGRNVPPAAPQSDEETLGSRIKAYLDDMSRTEAPEELGRLTRIVRRNVPFHLRGTFAAYLLGALGGAALGGAGLAAPPKAAGTPPGASRRPAGGGPASQGKVARLFINAGRSRRVYANDISDLFVSQLGIQRSELGEVRVLDNYSFVEIPSRHADRAISELTGKELRGRKLTVDYARPREAKKRE